MTGRTRPRILNEQDSEPPLDLEPPVTLDLEPPVTLGAERNGHSAAGIRIAVAPPGWPRALAREALHGVSGDFVQLLSPHTEADPVALLVQLLVAFGNLVGRTAYFVAEATRHYTNLNACLVGETSKGRKGSSWAQTKALLRLLDEPWERTRVVTGLSSGEGLIHQVRDAVVAQEPVKDKGRIVGYQEVVTDAGVSDKRLMVFEPEFASSLRMMERDGNTLSAVVREAWDTGELRVMTKNSPARATGAHISFAFHITRSELTRYMTRTEMGNGLANRILWTCVRRANVLPEGGAFETVDIAPLIGDLRAAVAFARVHACELRRDDDARELWAEIYPRLSTGRPGLLGAITSRAEAQTMRIACIYALLDRSELVRQAHLEAALGIWRYAEESAEFVFGDAIGDPDADLILVALRERPEGMLRSAINTDVFGRNVKAERIERALRSLAEYGLATSERVPTSGRAGEKWYALTNETKEVRGVRDGA